SLLAGEVTLIYATGEKISEREQSPTGFDLPDVLPGSSPDLHGCLVHVWIRTTPAEVTADYATLGDERITTTTTTCQLKAIFRRIEDLRSSSCFSRTGQEYFRSGMFPM